MMDALLDEIQNIVHFSSADLELFTSSFTETYIAKGEHFLLEGEISKRFGYIKSGLVMYYKIVDGIEIPADFAKENEWVAYLKSFNNGTASDMSIKALEDTHLLMLSNTVWNELLKMQPNFMALKSHYIELVFIRNTEHTANLVSLNAKERYYKFLKNHPDLVSRIPQYYIAAYLGIKPQSLSRLRR